LNTVTHIGRDDDDGGVGQVDDVHLVLTGPDRFNDDDVQPHGLHDRHDTECRPGEPPHISPCGDAFDENTVIFSMLLHTHPVTENGAPGVGTGGIDSQNTDTFSFFPADSCQGIHKCRFPYTRRTGQTDDVSAARMGKQLLEFRVYAGIIVVDSPHELRRGLAVSFNDFFSQHYYFLIIPSEDVRMSSPWS